MYHRTRPMNPYTRRSRKRNRKHGWYTELVREFVSRLDAGTCAVVIDKNKVWLNIETYPPIEKRGTDEQPNA